MTLTLKSFSGVFLLSVFFSIVSSAQSISTIAGNGTPGNSGDGGQALSASVYGNDIAADGAGNVYFVTDLTIRKVSSAGVITLLAGNGTTGTGGDGGLAIYAQFLTLRGIGADAAGNVYICDGNRVRKISTSGIISTIAGSTAAGNTGDGGQATAALLNAPADVATDGSNNVYITDRGNNRVRKITATTGVIAAHFSMNNCGFIAVTSNGAVYYTNYFNSIDKFYNGVNYPLSTGYSSYPYGPDGVLAYSNGYSTVQGLAVDEAGNIFLTANNKVRIIKANNYIYTYAGTGMAAFSGDGAAAYLAGLSDPKGVAVQGSVLYISDRGNYRVRKVNGCTGAPAIPGAITGPAAICSGNTYTFSVPASQDAFHYSWTFPSGWTVTGSNLLNTVTVTTNANMGPITVKAHNVCGIGPTQTHTFSNVVPIYIMPGGTYYTLCPGNTVQLAANVMSGVSYQWYHSTALMPGQTSPTLNVTANGTYKVVGTNTSGCSNSAQINVISPQATLHSPTWATSFCANDSLMLIGGHYMDTPTSVQWLRNGVVIPNAFTDTFYAKLSGTYTYTSITECITESDPYIFTAVDTPSFTITPASPLNMCYGESEIVSYNSTNTQSVQWKKNGVNLTTNFNMVANSEAVYSVVATGPAPYGCKSYSAPYIVTEDTLDIDISPLGVHTVCHDDTFTLHVTSGTGYSYQWCIYDLGILYDINGATNSSYVPQYPGMYRARVSYGVCQDRLSPSAIIVHLDTFQAHTYAATSTHLCPGESVQLNLTNLSVTGQWLKDGMEVPGQISQNYTVNTAGAYTVIWDDGFCSDTSDAIIVTEGTNPTPTITQSGSILSVPSGFISYQWYFYGSAISGANSETYTATQNGDYYVVVSDGCEGQSNTVNLFLSVGDVNAGDNSIVLRPNPFSDFAVLTFDNVQRLSHSFKLYNVQGQLVQEATNITSGELRIERGILPAGIYYYQLYKENSIVGNGKLVIQ